jgi:hypothetical protein
MATGDEIMCSRESFVEDILKLREDEKLMFVSSKPAEKKGRQPKEVKNSTEVDK